MPIKSYEQKQQEDFQRKQQQAAQLEQRKQELDAFAQMETQRKQEQDARLQASYDLYKRATVAREALERGEIDVAKQRANVPTLDGIFEAKAAQERVAEADAERQRIAAI